MSDRQQPKGISVRTMTIGVMLLVAYICWGIAASATLEPLVGGDGPSPGSVRSGRGVRLMSEWAITFVGNSLQVHRAPGVLANVLRHERWILATFLILEGLAAVFGVWVKMLDTKLNAPAKKRKRRRMGPRVEKPKPRKREGS